MTFHISALASELLGHASGHYTNHINHIFRQFNKCQDKLHSSLTAPMDQPILYVTGKCAIKWHQSSNENSNKSCNKVVLLLRNCLLLASYLPLFIVASLCRCNRLVSEAMSCEKFYINFGHSED